MNTLENIVKDVIFSRFGVNPNPAQVDIHVQKFLVADQTEVRLRADTDASFMESLKQGANPPGKGKKKRKNSHDSTPIPPQSPAESPGSALPSDPGSSSQPHDPLDEKKEE